MLDQIIIKMPRFRSHFKLHLAANVAERHVLLIASYPISRVYELVYSRVHTLWTGTFCEESSRVWLDSTG